MGYFMPRERGLLWLRHVPLQSLALRFGTNSFLLRNLRDPLYYKVVSQLPFLFSQDCSLLPGSLALEALLIGVHFKKRYINAQIQYNIQCIITYIQKRTVQRSCGHTLVLFQNIISRYVEMLCKVIRPRDANYRPNGQLLLKTCFVLIRSQAQLISNLHLLTCIIIMI